jgi:hypothetical protein
MADVFLQLVQRALKTKSMPSTFAVRDGHEEEDIAAAEAAGQIGPNTIIIRKFGHVALEQLGAVPRAP